jgi:peptidoglycan/LPS O-acetylase OafA/YrhL
MWSLSVEVAFYLLLPILALAMVWMRGPAARWRAPVVLAFGLVSLGWNLLPVPTPNAIHSDNWLPGYLPWFAVGMVLAELVEAPPVGQPSRWRRIAGNRWAMWSLALLALLLTATDLGGPSGLTRGQAWQYVTKMGLGALIGFGLLSPLILGNARHRWLQSRVAATIGRWSFGIFIWHLAVLSVVFQIFGIIPFHGMFLHVLALTVLFTLPLAAAGYALIEEPIRVWVRRRFG